LGRRLAYLVSQPVLADIAAAVALPASLAVSPGEARAGVKRRATVLADAMEAAIGALYLDGGIGAARRFVRRAWEPAMTGQIEPPKDAKTALQEWAQGRGLPLPYYELASRRGPPHSPIFVVNVAVDGHSGTGTAASKRAAEQAAATDLMRQLG
jgi:ribonuclease-3